MYKFKIEKLILNNDGDELIVIPKKINVLIGPNNSGKSRTLKDIRTYLSNRNDEVIIIKNIEYAKPQNAHEFNKAYSIDDRIIIDTFGNTIISAFSNTPDRPLNTNDSIASFYTNNAINISKDWKHRFQEDYLENPYNPHLFLNTFGPLFLQYLGNEERLLICKRCMNYSSDSSQINLLSSIAFMDDLLDDLSKYSKEMFHRDLYLDQETLGADIAFRVGDSFESIGLSARKDRSKAYELRNFPLLDDEGDGIKSFVSTFCSIKNRNKDILLIDEPESSLHPPLARKLGEVIGTIAEQGQQIFLATHSVDILLGLISTCKDINIIRMSRNEDGNSNIHIISDDILGNILHDPLLRNSRILDGLFAEKVLITEAESDELIYRGLIEKVSSASGLYFTHTHNKQRIARAADLYRQCGVSFSAIYDFDILRQPDEFSSAMKQIGVEENHRNNYINLAKKLRQSIDNEITFSKNCSEEAKNKKLQKHRSDIYHKKGISYVKSTGDYIAFDNMLRKLQEHNIFILKSGELETILEPFGFLYSSNKTSWVAKAIEKIDSLTKNDIIRVNELFDYLSKIVS